jgi:hypothetical protein
MVQTVGTAIFVTGSTRPEAICGRLLDGGTVVGGAGVVVEARDGLTVVVVLGVEVAGGVEGLGSTGTVAGGAVVSAGGRWRNPFVGTVVGTGTGRGAMVVGVRGGTVVVGAGVTCRLVRGPGRPSAESGLAACWYLAPTLLGRAWPEGRARLDPTTARLASNQAARPSRQPLPAFRPAQRCFPEPPTTFPHPALCRR